jgi:hypothetical protein
LFFSAGTVFFSHKKSANSVFQPAYNSSRTAPLSLNVGTSIAFPASLPVNFITGATCQWHPPRGQAQLRMKTVENGRKRTYEIENEIGLFGTF